VRFLYPDHGTGCHLFRPARQTDVNTKERILQAAIDLFAKQGYDAVSMRDLAAAVGIKAASLYKHFASKEELLECIFQAYRDLMQHSNEIDDALLAQPETLSPQQFLTASFQSFKDMILSPHLLKITRIITMEQTRNTSVRDFFFSEMIEKPITQLTEMFSYMQQCGRISQHDPAFLAKTYHAYIISLYYTNTFLMAEVDLEQVENEMLAFINFFCEALL
jgi:TetR/AcrR family transcriptional regulator, biofilm operon repressor